jgi:hypothetical protein
MVEITRDGKRASQALEAAESLGSARRIQYPRLQAWMVAGSTRTMVRNSGHAAM